MYKLYGTVRSRAFRVIWTLEEIGEPYELIAVGPQSPEVLAVNAAGKIPVLETEGAMLTDSAAIMAYLADKHGKLTYPAGTLDRARQDALTHMLNDEFDAALWMAARHSFVLPEEHRVPAVVETLKWEYARSLARLEERMVGPYLQGEQMTVADILCTHCLNWGHATGFTVTSQILKDYAKAMRGRAAFRRAQAHAGDTAAG